MIFFSFRNFLSFVAFSLVSFELVSVLVPSFAFAATVVTQPSEIRLGVGQEMMLDVLLRLEGEEVNALEGTMSPPSGLEIKEIRDQDSVVSLWVERPRVRDGRIEFSGVIPGGYGYPNAKVFSLVLRATEPSQNAMFTFAGWRVLRNDGKGSEVTLSLAPPAVHVSAEAVSSVPAVMLLADDEAPEPFAIQLTQDPAVFDGQWFIVFSTLDKGSGIDHYEIREERDGDGEWIRGESPYVLRDQSRMRTISVRAVDRVGNERISVLAAPVSFPESSLILYRPWVILVILLVSIGWFLVSRLRKRDR